MAALDTPLIWPALGGLYAVLDPWVEAVLRFAVGMAMVPHGLRMCLGYFKGTGIAVSSVGDVAAMFDRKGYRPAKFWAYGVVFTQFVAAPCVALGLFTRPMALPLFVLLALSAYDHGRYDGYFWNRSGVEYPAMWAAGALYFLVNGGGEISLDRLVLGWEF
jgi:putative oxidoreductase